MKKLILISIIALISPKNSFSTISIIDSTKADSCGYALAQMAHTINNLSEVGFCKFRYYTSKFESNLISHIQLRDSLNAASVELTNYVNTQAQNAAILIRNNYINHSNISGFDDIMRDRWDIELDTRPNVGCYAYANSIWNCKAGALTCIDAAAILCIGSTIGYPFCLAVSTGACMIGFSICTSEAEANHPGCAGNSSGGITWKPWIVNPAQVPTTAAECN